MFGWFVGSLVGGLVTCLIHGLVDWCLVGRLAGL